MLAINHATNALERAPKNEAVCPQKWGSVPQKMGQCAPKNGAVCPQKLGQCAPKNGAVFVVQNIFQKQFLKIIEKIIFKNVDL